MGFLNKVKDLIGKHDDKVDKALDKAGQAAKGRFAGHADKIDDYVGKAKAATGEGDTTRRPADPVAQPPVDQARGVDGDPNAPGGQPR